jgi:hypothetical protein
MDEDIIPPSEAAREKRRDRDAEAHARAGMKTGLAKQFKQVLDAQTKRAEETEWPRRDADAAPAKPGHGHHRRGA